MVGSGTLVARVTGRSRGTCSAAGRGAVLGGAAGRAVAAAAAVADGRVRGVTIVGAQRSLAVVGTALDGRPSC